ncbi:unnamed protein product [Medioppia subpectinata]|uniref:Peptidase S1 domain-containing protein n=1 Tax=Medioppia subpectinata TaxID=1979941 RepID=A0A7R9KHE4_9ACAR|nr:unnamed protein product [Medioppia subpectinata]CAG2103383.1 unnamed protein product [Medioppia subpectinata]
MFIIIKFVLITTLIQFISCEIIESFDNCGQPYKQVPKDGVSEYGWLAQVWRLKPDADKLPEKEKYKDNQCMASIISDNWLLGAASCLPLKNSQYAIKMVNLPEKFYQVDKIVKSPEYNPTLGAGYDLALIKLKSGLQLHYNDEKVRAICLSDFGTGPEDRSQVKVTTDCLLHNYGPLDEQVPDKARTLVKDSIHMAEATDCEKVYHKLFKEPVMFCSNKAIYEGNNGAPITCPDDNYDGTTHFLSAIASWGRKKAVYPTVKFEVYTKLIDGYYITWINNTIHAKN